MKRNVLQNEIGEIIFDFVKENDILIEEDDIEWQDLFEEEKDLYCSCAAKIIFFLNIRYRTKL